MARMVDRSSTAPGRGWKAPSMGIAMARRTCITVVGWAGTPWSFRHMVTSSSASTRMSSGTITVPPFRSRDLLMMSLTSSVARSSDRSGRTTRSRASLPSESVARTGQEFGHSVPPMSTRAAARGGFMWASIIAFVLRFLTAGESHGPQLTVVIEGLPAGLEISEDDLRQDLARRQGGHGRGGRQKIETDFARIVSGVRGGFTIGSPVTLVLENKDHVNWTEQMTASKEGFAPKPITRLRPGHADLAGALKYGHSDVRNVLERSSARETATRVAAGGVARKLLGQFGAEILSFTQSIGATNIGFDGVDVDAVSVAEIEASPVRCPDPEASALMVADIDAVGERGDTLGGTFRVIARGLPPGLGSFVHWDRKRDGLLAHAVRSLNADKGLAFGAGYEVVTRPGSQSHAD